MFERFSGVGDCVIAQKNLLLNFQFQFLVCSCLKKKKKSVTLHSILYLANFTSTVRFFFIKLTEKIYWSSSFETRYS